MFRNIRTKKTDVFSVTGPVYMIARMFGYWPFRVKFGQRSGLNSIYVTRFDWLWFAAAIIIYSLFFWSMSTNYYLQNDIPYSFIEVFISKMTHLCSILISILSMVMDSVNRRRIWNIILKFNEFDEKVTFYFRNPISVSPHVSNIFPDEVDGLLLELSWS